MGQVPDETRIHVNEWKGRVSHPNPKDIPAGGFTDVMNLSTREAGRLQVRQGIQPATFTNAGVAINSQIIGIYNFIDDTGEIVIYELADGTVRAGRGVS